MFNKKFLLLIGLVFFFVIIQSISALTASSENYSVSRFGTGVQAINLNSTDLTGHALSITGASTRNAEDDNFTVNVGFWANTSYHVTVSITSYSIYPKSATAVSLIRLSISALHARSVWARITRPDGVNETVVLLNNDYAYYTAGIVGRYNIIFYANSSLGAIASAADYFDLTEQPTTPSSPPDRGGGGGTTIIIEKCSYIWDCTAWSICSDLEQTRECKNLGDCTGIERKPIETRECSDSLFDVVMTFKELGLTPDGILRFSIDLTETKNVEKIDVQIRYSIIDSENNEIISQIETRAIQKNLTYEKEINQAKLINGDYILRVDVLYGKLQRAFAEQRFKIENGIIIRVGPTLEFNYDILLIISVPLIILVLLILLIRLRSSFMPKRDRHPTRFEKARAKSHEKNILLKRKRFLGRWKKHKKYSVNSVLRLINRKVYSDNGNYIGEIKDVILGKNRIESLKINLDKKHKFKTKGIIVNYKYVRSVGEIIIIDKAVAEHLEKYKDSGRNLII